MSLLFGQNSSYVQDLVVQSKLVIDTENDGGGVEWILKENENEELEILRNEVPIITFGSSNTTISTNLIVDGSSSIGAVAFTGDLDMAGYDIDNATNINATNVNADNFNGTIITANQSNITTVGEQLNGISVRLGETYKVNGFTVLTSTNLGSSVVNSNISTNTNNFTNNGWMNLLVGKDYRIDGASVLSQTTLGGDVVNASLTHNSGNLTNDGVMNLTNGNDYWINSLSVLSATTLGSTVVNSSLTTNNASMTINGTSTMPLVLKNNSASAQSLLTIGDVNNERMRLGYYLSTMVPTNGAIYAQIFTDTTGNLNLSTRTSLSSAIKLYTCGDNATASERMRINSNGTVSIGNTNSTYALDITGDSNISGSYYIGGASVLSSTTVGSTVVNSSITTNTSTRLDQIGQFRVVGDSSGMVARFGATSAGTIGYITVGDGSSGDRTRLGYSHTTTAPTNGLTPSQILTDSTGNLMISTRTNFNSSMKFYTCGDAATATERMRITNAGYVGIGTTAPLVPFTVSDGTALSGTNITTGMESLYSTSATNILNISHPNQTQYLNLGYNSLNKSGTTAGVLSINNSTNSYMTFGTNNTERMRINASGNVSLGNTNDTYALDIFGNMNNGPTATPTFATDTSSRTLGAYNISVQNNMTSPNYLTSSSDMTIQTTTSNNILFGTGGSERMRLNTSGYLGIGATTVSKDIHIQRSTNADVGILVEQTNNINSDSHAAITLNTTGASSGDAKAIFTNNVQTWSVGLDNSDSDYFKISRSSLVGTNVAISVDTSNNVGIGGNSTGAKFYVNGSISGTSSITVAGNITSSSGNLSASGNVSANGFLFGRLNFLAAPINIIADTLVSGGWLTLGLTASTSATARVAIISCLLQMNPSSSSQGAVVVYFRENGNGSASGQTTESIGVNDAVGFAMNTCEKTSQLFVPLNSAQQLQYQVITTGAAATSLLVSANLVGYM